MRSFVLTALLSLASAAATPSNCVVGTTADCSNKFFSTGASFFQLSCGASVTGTPFADVGSVQDFASCISSCSFNTACSIARFDSNAKVCHMYGTTASVSATASADNVAVKLAGNPCISTTTTTTTTTVTMSSTTTVKPTTSSTTVEPTTTPTTKTTSSTATSTSSAMVKPTSTTTSALGKPTSITTTSTNSATVKPTSTTATTTTSTGGSTMKSSSTTTGKSSSTSSVWTTWSGTPWVQWSTPTPTFEWTTWSATKPAQTNWNGWAPGVTVVYVTTSYVDICPTGYTTIPFTTAVTVTITGKTTPTGNYVWPSQSNGCPSGYYTKTTVCNQGCGPAPTTVVVTLPLAPGATSTWGSWATGTPVAATSSGAWNSWNGVNVYRGAASNVETKGIFVLFTALFAGLLAM